MLALKSTWPPSRAYKFRGRRCIGTMLGVGRSSNTTTENYRPRIRGNRFPLADGSSSHQVQVHHQELLVKRMYTRHKGAQLSLRCGSFGSQTEGAGQPIWKQKTLFWPGQRLESTPPYHQIKYVGFSGERRRSSGYASLPAVPPMNS